MSAGTSPSDGTRRTLAEQLAPMRVVGGVAARFVRDGGPTRVQRLGERGGYRLAQPESRGEPREVLLVNTGGGVAGGDRVELRYAIGDGADVLHTTSSAERVYRSAGDRSHIDIHLELAPRARLDWSPHQTIVYGGGALERSLSVDMDATSRLLIVELLSFGRPGSKESGQSTYISDQWRIRRNGRLVFAEALKIDEPMAELLGRPAVGGGARASAIVLLAAPGGPDFLDPLRTLIADMPDCGVSSWRGLVAVRMLAHDAGDLVRRLGPVITLLSGRPLPRAWAI